MSVPLPPGFFYIPEFNRRYAVKAYSDYSGCEPTIYSLIAPGTKTPSPMSSIQLNRGKVVRIATYSGGWYRNRLIRDLIKLTMNGNAFKKAKSQYLKPGILVKRSASQEHKSNSFVDAATTLFRDRVGNNMLPGTKTHSDKWLVMRIAGGTVAQIGTIYSTEAAARAAAKELAENYPTQTYSVFKSVSVVKSAPTLTVIDYE